jgi:hypothetical protein
VIITPARKNAHAPPTAGSFAMTGEATIEADTVSTRLPRRVGAALFSAPTACLILGVVIWQIFRPGLLDGDGMAAYRSALANSYADWQPPLLALLLHGMLRLGHGHSVFTLLQCVTGCLGVWCFARAVLTFWYGERLSPQAARSAALGVLLLLLLPVSPFLFYLAHFGKDTWGIIAVLWIGVCSLNLYRRNGPASGWLGILKSVGLVALITLFIEVRYNAILALPVFATLVFVLFRPWGKWAGALGAVAVAVLPPLVDFGIHRVFAVQRVYPQDQVMANELIGMCVLNESVLAELPFTEKHLVKERYRREYLWETGDVVMPWWKPAPIVTPGYITFGLEGHQQMAREYWSAALRHPWLLARVKMKAFRAILLDEQPLWHHRDLDANEMGLALNPRFATPRNYLLGLDQWINNDPFLRWVGARHLPWLLLTLATLLGLAARGVWRRDGKLLFACLLSLVPVIYYLSFLAARAGSVFRYMYPATLCVQAVAIGMVIGWIFWLRERSQRAAALEELLRQQTMEALADPEKGPGRDFKRAA